MRRWNLASGMFNWYYPPMARETRASDWMLESSVPSQKTPFVGRRKRRVGNLRYWNSKSAERERSAEKLLGSRERVGKQVLFCSGSTEILCLEGGGRTKYGSTGTDVMVFGRSGWCSDVGEVTSG
jgi:hypothetical protein